MDSKQTKHAAGPWTHGTHRAIQLSAWAERASTERVNNYCRAIKAESILNNGAARYFTARAQKWENIRIRATRAAIAKAKGE